jgi:hypothetical protein
MASHNPDPTSRSNQPFDQRIIDLAKSAGDQAPLHDPGGRETPPARDSQGSTPFVVRVGLEAARSYPASQGESASDLILRITADIFRRNGLSASRAEFAAWELWTALRPLDLHT